MFNPLEYPICFEKPLRITESGWLEHIPFGMFIVDLIYPKCLVELGTHQGISYCAFCQAIYKLNIPSKCYAIDTWQGDQQAGYYSNKILEELRSYHDQKYGSFSQLIQSTFDEGVNYFSNSSIDLLHIDGLHTYEAVKHDFNTWSPKLSNRAIVVFHDTNERRGDFGVWKFWEEIEAKYPSFEFYHGHGLGIAAIGSKYPKQFNILLGSINEQNLIRNFFETIGNKVKIEFSLLRKKNETMELKTQLHELREKVKYYSQSNSWRITKPLRKIANYFRRHRDGKKSP